jgi:uncharacterized protein
MLVIVNLKEPLLFVLGRLLLGFWIGRNRILHEPERHHKLIGALFFVTFGVGAAAALIAPVLGRVIPGEFVHAWAAPFLYRLSGLTVGFSYAMGFSLLFMRAPWRKYLQVLAPAGRMALTNYLMETLISVPVFYGFGLAVGPWLGWPGRVAAFCILFPAQVAFSHWWLKRFRFGPAEWAWRSLTYGKLQRFRVAPQAPA